MSIELITPTTTHKDVSTTERTTAAPAKLLAEFMTPEEVAAAFGIVPRSLWALHRAGKAPPRIKFGRRTYYSRVAVVQWLHEQQEKPRQFRARRSRRTRTTTPQSKGGNHGHI
jgi:predicted DNA-binding transcriptional regulator AlpA